MIYPRYNTTAIHHDLSKKMVFIGGPRQVGKTTLAASIGKAHYPHFSYYNWDDRLHRQQILKEQFDPKAKLLIFDELHKYRQWKQYVKGVYDTQKERFRIIVTGSARLDLYRKGGDSLQGRYHFHRLHPFSLAESMRHTAPLPLIMKEIILGEATREATERFQTLLTFGGFPEPFLAQEMRTLRRWHNERVDRIIKEDIRDLESIRDLSALQVLVEILPRQASSLLSLNALREDLQVTHKTVALWVDVLERFYYHFRIYPYGATPIKSLRKQPKIYLWDWSEITDEGRRLENMVASHLLKMVQYLEDTEGHRAELFYLRDTEGREVDFLVTVNRKPWFAVEVKQSQEALHKPLLYFGERLRIPFLYQIVTTPNVDILQDNIRIVSASSFLAGLV